MNKALHKGIITAIDGDTATLRLIDTSDGCKGCAMALLCSKPQTVRAALPEALTYKPGDCVGLTLASASRSRAIAMLLAVPLALLISGLSLGSAQGWGDGASALCGIAACAAWYASLALTTRPAGATPKFEITQKIDQ